jgi:hypothetical protein
MTAATPARENRLPPVSSSGSIPPQTPQGVVTVSALSRAAQPRFDRSDVASNVAGRVPTILAHFGIQAHQLGREYKTSQCPECGPRSRNDAVSINGDTGAWKDHAHGCRGSVFDMVALYAGLGRNNFRDALQLTAEILGVAPLTANAIEREIMRSREQHRLHAQRSQQAAEDAARLALARTVAPVIWQTLQWRNAECETYLQRRGLGALVTHACGETATLVDRVNLHNRADGPIVSDAIVKFAPVVRATDAGRMVNRLAVCVPVRDFHNGAKVNVVARALEPGNGPKVYGLPKLPKQGAFGAWLPNWGRLGTGPDQIRNVILVEGLMDYLTARLAWPRALVLGADGAGELHKIATAIAPTIAKSGARLTIVPHRDGATPNLTSAGQRGAEAAIKTAIDGGLRVNRTLYIQRLPTNDLNDAWCSGWRPHHE